MQALFHNHLRGDRTIWMVALILGVISLLAVYSSIASLAVKHEGGTARFLFKHLLMLASGGLIMYWASRLKHGIYSRLSQLLLGLTAALLLLTLLTGSNINDASRWLKIPLLGVTFQTSDLAKVVLVVYVARALAKHRDRLDDIRVVVRQVLLPVLVICGLILPANFSTAAVLFAVCFLLMFVGGVPLKHLFTFVALAVAGFALLLVLSKSFPGLLPRIDTWVTRIESFGVDDHEANYQVEHAKIAIASGGVLPNGPGTGASRNFLPHPYSDMIYAFIVEEYGSLFGGVGLVLLYLILLFRAVRIAYRCDKPFGALVAMGLATLLVLQALINMAVAVNLVPVTGQPLPLVSMGGTSIWFTCLAIGIVLSVSRTVYDNENEASEQRGTRRTTVIA